MTWIEDNRCSVECWGSEEAARKALTRMLRKLEDAEAAMEAAEKRHAQEIANWSKLVEQLREELDSERRANQ